MEVISPILSNIVAEQSSQATTKDCCLHREFSLRSVSEFILRKFEFQISQPIASYHPITLTVTTHHHLCLHYFNASFLRSKGIYHPIYCSYLL